MIFSDLVGPTNHFPPGCLSFGSPITFLQFLAGKWNFIQLCLITCSRGEALIEVGMCNWDKGGGKGASGVVIPLVLEERW